MARILIAGTLAYDDIGWFDSPLTAQTRNVKLERLHRDFGGCAMNIAYNLAGLGHRPVPFVYAGEDYSGDYARHVAGCGISEAGIFRIAGTTSARGIVLTGSDGAQFTAFYPGPSGLERWAADLEAVLDGEPFDAAILAPDLPAKMSGCASRLDAPVLRIWCPGQYAELLEADDLAAPLAWCNLLVVNRHEWQALCRGADPEVVAAQAGRLVITDGPGPVEIRPGGQCIPVPQASPGRASKDPTGCGDAFVAALASELLSGRELPAAVVAGIRLAGRCLLCRGAQKHVVAP